MAWNIFMHILIGLLGTQHFTIDAKGILFCLLIVSFTQASELVRFYVDGKKRVEKGPERNREADMAAFKKGLPKILPPMFAQNLMMYSAIVLFSAEIGRTTGYGV
ncbi:MAG: hypothetical protein RQ824_05820 [bacterium]|nr:hypothetical protein [bacterium]